ncbi:MAG TPA: tetratricopeptide repeat protein [Candidatus Methanoperedens sp.]|nr:tetratricopeptide repeat protein [Candidatus Methanoperedens sp.]
MRQDRRAWALAAGLVAAVALAFLPVLGNGFVEYDDHVLIYENKVVQGGLTADGVAWAFRSTEQANWFPLTRLSHLLDVQLFGIKAAGHHATSLLLHLLNAVILFASLRAATGALWRSALVAGLFALHPLRVESVAWASERKDVLSVFFWVLGLAAWVRYARRPTWPRYLLTAAALALGLMAKPLLVTLPAALLLLDLWPLGRWLPRRPAAAGGATPARLLLEKIPLLGLSAGSAVLTFWAQREAGAVSMSHVASWPVRLENAALSYLKYLGKTFVPADLSPLYAFAMHRPAAGQVAAAVLLLAALTAATLWAWRRRPEVLVGWLWYLGTLVPMIGIVQVGVQAMADRYTYIPQVGLFLALVWAAGALAARWPRLGPALAAAAVAALATLGVLANAQTRHWRDTSALFQQALRVDPRNIVAHINLGLSLTKRGRLAEANEAYRAALAISPRLRQVNYFVGVNLFNLGRRGEALSSFLSELALFPGEAVAHGAAGMLLQDLGRVAEAEGHFREGLRLDPMQSESHRGLGILFLERGDLSRAAYHLEVATRLNPRDPLAARKLREARARAAAPPVRPGP